MKKGIAMVLAAAMMCMALGGCGEKQVSEGGQTSFTYWAELPTSAASQIQSMNDMTMYQELEKRTGVQITFTHPPVGQSAEQFNLLIASGASELPDMIEYSWTSYPGGPDKAISDGILLDLTELIDKHAPNLKKQLEENEIYKKQASTDSGALYGFPSLNVGKYRTFGGLIIRKDWLDDLGLEMPETLDEWENVLRQFKEQKGAKAPLTFTSGNISTSYHFNNIYDVGLSTYVDDETIKFPQMEPGYREYLELMHKWYEEGLLDAEYDTNNQTVVDAKMTNGTSGVTYGFIGGTIGRYVNAMKEKDPNYKLAAAQFPVKNKGDEPRFMECQKEANTPFVAITTNCKDPEAAVKWLDYMYSEEGMILKNFGVEGVTYNEVDGHYVYTDEILHNADGLSIAEAMAKHFRANAPSPGFNQHEDYLQQYYELPEQREALEVWTKYTENAKETVVPPITSTLEENEELISLKNEIETYTNEMVVKFIKGIEPLSNYDKFLEELKKMGVERLIELNQAALDRYYQR